MIDIKSLVKESKEKREQIEAKKVWSESDFITMYWSGAKMRNGEFQISKEWIEQLSNDKRTPFKIRHKIKCFLQFGESFSFSFIR